MSTFYWNIEKHTFFHVKKLYTVMNICINKYKYE